MIANVNNCLFTIFLGKLGRLLTEKSNEVLEGKKLFSEGHTDEA